VTVLLFTAVVLVLEVELASLVGKELDVTPD
jgi:hypothetical protein